ncbi:MAG: ABC transporter permease [Actinomycetota bacterium]|nr:ABC transporter permease [Actinomycetota bacterium]
MNTAAVPTGTSTHTTTENPTMDASTPHATVTGGVQPVDAVPLPAGRAGFGVAALTVAGRSIRQFRRTPQLIVVGALTSAMFLLIFRFVFGGAIEVGGVAYANFLIPALAVTTGLFATGAVGLAEDLEGGVIDRFRSLPVPRSSILVGRSLADTVLATWGTATTLVLGFAVGFRPQGSAAEALAALGLCLLFGAVFTWPMITIGLVSGTGQAAQGMSFLVFPFVFVSSAYVPVDSMPGWLQPVAEHQPVTAMIGAVRALTIGPDAESVLGHSAGWYTMRALAWSAVIVAVFATIAARRFARL